MTYEQTRLALLGVTVLVVAALSSQRAFAQEAGQGNAGRMDPEKTAVIEYWNDARRAAAVPRDLVVDPRGLGYLRRQDGSLQPHGHQIVAEPATGGPGALAGTPNAGPGNDTSAPSISDMDPGANATIGESHTFSAVVTDDASGVRSVSFVIRYPSGLTESFQAGAAGNDVWVVNFRGFTDGNWSWWVEARDGARKGGNRASSAELPFVVDTGGSGGGGSSGATAPDTVTNAEWTAGGDVQTAAGRVYFEMPSNARRKGPWNGYVCSGTVVTDATDGRSMILTAAHCVYDDVNKAYARNVLFVPNQAGTSGSGTDLNCNNDPLGCWVPSFGVVDTNWTTRTFPDNIPWDYAYYVVDDSGSHAGASSGSDSLEAAAGALPVSFFLPYSDDGVEGGSSLDFTHALGYSYSEDPNFMYCAEDMTTEGDDNWWLPSCGLSGGSSGGPWVQPMNSSGSGPVMSVNSWGYTNSPGMAGPKLVNTSAECVFEMAKTLDWSTADGPDGDAGHDEPCP